MVHGLTAQSGGAMEIASRLGKGTTVTLWLPRARPEDFLRAPEVQAAPSDDAATSKLHILVVDDDALVSMNTADMLTDLGHGVVEAQSAAHALQLLESDSRFDAVVTDYAMPAMNGLELATRIRQRTPGLPVILATGYAELPTNAAIAFPRLAKPYTQEQLAEVLDLALNSRGP
jgi:CheY-like chemotaxis protein